MLETFSYGQEDDIKGRSMVLGKVRDLHQGVQGHRNNTYPTSACP
jgi:hypothetical protein